MMATNNEKESEMFGNPSLMTRIAVGKTAGFVIGLAAMWGFNHFIPDISSREVWGILFWYTTVGAVIGMFGVMNWHPILKMPMPWWFRAPFLGAWMNTVLLMFAYDLIARGMIAIFGEGGALQSPYWFVVEGAIVGMIIGYLATRFGGEGPSTVSD